MSEPETTEQPGATQSYSSRVAYQSVLKAVSGLRSWAQIEVLEWALAKARAEYEDERSS